MSSGMQACHYAQWMNGWLVVGLVDWWFDDIEIAMTANTTDKHAAQWINQKPICTLQHLISINKELPTTGNVNAEHKRCNDDDDSSIGISFVFKRWGAGESPWSRTELTRTTNTSTTVILLIIRWISRIKQNGQWCCLPAINLKQK